MTFQPPLFFGSIFVSWHLWYLYTLSNQPYCMKCFRPQSPIYNFGNRGWNEGYMTHFKCYECDLPVLDRENAHMHLKEKIDSYSRAKVLLNQGYSAHIYLKLMEDDIKKIEYYIKTGIYRYTSITSGGLMQLV